MLPETLEDAVSYVEQFQILDLTWARQPSPTQLFESDDGLFVDVDLTNDTNDEGANGGTPAPPPPPPRKLPSLKEHLGFGDDQEAWLDFRVISFLQTLSNWASSWWKGLCAKKVLILACAMMTNSYMSLEMLFVRSMSHLAWANSGLREVSPSLGWWKPQYRTFLRCGYYLQQKALQLSTEWGSKGMRTWSPSKT